MRALYAAVPRSVVFAFSLGLALAAPLLAGSTGATALLTPQGSGGGTANGDYISADPGGLDTFYRYFIEVPANTPLVVEIFDADLGIGGDPEGLAGRDRDRGGFDSSATYSLIDPTGTARPTRFTTGNTTTPVGADNAWLTLFSVTGNSVRDNFGTVSFANNDGNNNWTGNWIEVDAGGAGAGAGSIQVTGGELRIKDGVTGTPEVQREADLLGSPGLNLSTAFLTFDYRTSNTLDNNDSVLVQVSANGGGAWTTLETFTNDSSGSRSYDITTSIANNTRIRFLTNGVNDADEFFYVDNVQITDGARVAGHWELRVDMSSAVTGGDDINAIGIRAHNGDSGAGGTELNVYFDSHNQHGVNPPNSGTNSRSYDFFPYLTSGCTAAKNDFDHDSNSGNVGSMAFTSRSGSFVRSFASSALSANNVWRRDSFNGWTSDSVSGDYGIWRADLTINSYLVGGTPNGNYANLWMSNYAAAANPPAANPTANAFRVYLPNDAGAAPAKPYVEQLLTHSGCGASGPNPPVVGQTSCYTVTVKVVNPAAQAITFSASNLVTANVPGGGAVAYAGNAQVSQGSILSQPAVGGTGNITWNPGSVAPGATALLAYRLNVTPTSAGQRILVTATPASGNGTRAQYLDETGNSAQARATYQFGPLCELAVTENLLTEAVVSSFQAFPAAGGGVLVEWSTASEAGTSGFYLQRWDASARRWVSVHRNLLPGLLHAPQGGIYRYLDEGASSREPQAYRLEEVEAGGRRRMHGPYNVTAGGSARRATAVYERAAHPAERAPRPAATPALGKSSVVLPEAGHGLHLSVSQTGLYYLRVSDLAAWFGMRYDKAEKDLALGRFSLTRDGQPVAWHPDIAATTTRRANGLFFYGEAPASDDLYSGATVYRLERGPGLLMEKVMTPAAQAVAGGIFGESLHTERDLFAATVISPEPDSDYWFWEFLLGGDATHGRRVFTLGAPGLAAGSDGSLTVTLHGATASGVAEEHRATVILNGAVLGEAAWQGLVAKTASFPVPPGLLAEAGNQVEVTAQLGTGVPYSVFYVDSFDLSYGRSPRAAGDALAFTAGGAAASPAVTVTGFSAPPALLDVSDPLQPRWISGGSVEEDGAGFRVTFQPEASGRYFAAASSGFATPAAIRPWSEPALKTAGHGADYLVITPLSLWNAAGRLAGYRRAEGLEAELVELEKIADEFGHGVLTPEAIRSFLAWAWQNWSPKPRYVALAGQGTLDYRGRLGYGDNLVPPRMIKSEGGLFPSDNSLGDVDGDGLPEMAVGRIPVLTEEELDAFIAKLAGYESAAAADWTGRALLLADAPDGGADFSADSEGVAAQLPADYTVDRVYLSATPLADARAHLLAALGEGAALVNYVGHGGLDRLSSSGLLTNADASALVNGERLPVMTAMTCTVNRFAVPGISALGEELVKSPAGGAAAVWGPTGLSSAGQARLLAERFYRPGTEERLGDRILRAVREYRELGGDPALPVLYDLMGDPALRLRRPPAPGTGAGVGTGE